MSILRTLGYVGKKRSTIFAEDATPAEREVIESDESWEDSESILRAMESNVDDAN
jgi:hypothetical protein